MLQTHILGLYTLCALPGGGVIVHEDTPRPRQTPHILIAQRVITTVHVLIERWACFILRLLRLYCTTVGMHPS